MESGREIRPWAVRVPAGIIDWLRDRAARETLRQKKVVSMNAIAVEILQTAMEKDLKKKKLHLKDLMAGKARQLTG